VPVRTKVGSPETDHTYAAIPDKETGVISPGTPVEAAVDTLNKTERLNTPEGA